MRNGTKELLGRGAADDALPAAVPRAPALAGRFSRRRRPDVVPERRSSPARDRIPTPTSPWRSSRRRSPGKTSSGFARRGADRSSPRACSPAKTPAGRSTPARPRSIVSNHGARQLDCVSPTLRALPEVVEAVNGHAEVLLDGGIRRGSDVAKALCLGATSRPDRPRLRLRARRRRRSRRRTRDRDPAHRPHSHDEAARLRLGQGSGSIVRGRSVRMGL